MPPQENQNPGQATPAPLQPLPAASFIPRYGVDLNTQPVAPLQPLPAQPVDHVADYSFIFAPDKPAAPKIPLASSSKPTKLLLLVGGLAVLLVLALVGFKLLAGGGSNVASLTSVAEQQTEIVRVAQLAISQTGVAQSTKNVAVTASVAIGTDQKSLTTYLSKHGHKLGTKQLALGHNAQNDQALTSAASAGNFDSAYMALLQTQLTKYSSSLQQAYALTKSTSLQQLLNTDYNNAQLLQTQSKSN